MAQLQAGSGAVVAPEIERRLVASGEDRAALLVALCRKVLNVFYLERLLLVEIEIGPIEETRLDARASFGRHDPERHAEGLDIKAVTYAQAAVEALPGGGFEATLIFDI